MKTPLSMMMPLKYEEPFDPLPGTPQLLMHLNGNLVDAVGGTTRDDADAAYVTGKFKQGLGGCTGAVQFANSGDRSTTLISASGVTFACWYYLATGTTPGQFLNIYNSDASHGMFFSVSHSSGYIGPSVSLGEPSTNIYANWSEDDFNFDAWNYITLSFTSAGGGAAYYSLNGDVKAATGATGISALTYTGIMRLQAGSGVGVDELAVANNWYISSNFTPPSLPWGIG